MSNERTAINTTVYTEDVQKVAKRIYDIMDPWEKDFYEFTVESVADDMIESPISAIKWLLDRIENYQEATK